VQAPHYSLPHCLTDLESSLATELGSLIPVIVVLDVPSAIA